MKLFLVNCTITKYDNIAFGGEKTVFTHNINVFAETENEAKEKLINHWSGKDEYFGDEPHEWASKHEVEVHYIEPAIY
jgi:hypothetical protein